MMYELLFSFCIAIVFEKKFHSLHCYYIIWITIPSFLSFFFFFKKETKSHASIEYIFSSTTFPPHVKVNDADIQLSSLPSSRRTVNIAQCSREDGRKARGGRKREEKKNKEKKEEKKKKSAETPGM